MPDQKLIDYLKAAKGKGYSAPQLKPILIKQGYTEKEIDKAFASLEKKNDQQKEQPDIPPDTQKGFPPLASFTLLNGFSLFSLLVTFLVVLLTISLESSQVSGYILLSLAGALIGFYIYHVAKTLKVKDSLKVLWGVLSPGFSLVLILGVFTLLKVLAEQLTSFAGGGMAEGIGGMVSIFSAGPDPVIVGILFYLFCNLFIIIEVIKNKNPKAFFWYLLAPALFFMIWLVVEVILKIVIDMKLGF